MKAGKKPGKMFVTESIDEKLEALDTKSKFQSYEPLESADLNFADLVGSADYYSSVGVGQSDVSDKLKSRGKQLGVSILFFSLAIICFGVFVFMVIQTVKAS